MFRHYNRIWIQPAGFFLGPSLFKFRTLNPEECNSFLGFSASDADLITDSDASRYGYLISRRCFPYRLSLSLLAFTLVLSFFYFLSLARFNLSHAWFSFLCLCLPNSLFLSLVYLSLCLCIYVSIFSLYVFL